MRGLIDLLAGAFRREEPGGAPHRRSLDAASDSWRLADHKTLSSLNASNSPTVRRRAAYQARNNAHMVRGVGALVSNSIGTGIWPRSRHPDPAVRKRLNDRFARWSDACDASGRLDLPGIESLATRGMIEVGESFLRRVRGVDGGLQLQLIHADQVDQHLTRDLDGGGRIRAGVELDPVGRPLAYHVLPQRPGDLAPFMFNHVRLPAREVIHLFQVLEVGQVRGLSWLAPVLPRSHNLSLYEEAQLERQKVAALFAGFLLDPQGDAAGFDGDRKGDGVLETGLEPGTMKILPPGYDIKFSDPAEIGENGDFVKSQLRAIAAGIGVTYEQLTGDLTGVNYSSIRAGLIEFRRLVEALRWTVIVPQLCRPLWRWYLESEVLAGTVSPAAFQRDPAPFLAADWHAPGWDWVDPKKDIEAEIAAVDAGFKARQQVIAEMGEDPDQVDELRRQDQAREPARPRRSAAIAEEVADA